jgi:hypothetical protein
MAVGTLALMAVVFGVLVLLNAPPRVSSLDAGYLRRDNFGADWPLLVEDGRVECRPGRQVVFISDGITYGVNGPAQATHSYRNIEQIWASDPAVSGAKKDIGPIIDAGLKLCK